MAAQSPLHFDVHGDGAGSGDRPYVLMLHGYLSSRAQWLPNVDALCDVARPVVVEMLGHGRSPSPEESDAYSPEAYVDDFERIRAELGAERWFVIGQSLGAALTLRYALDCPERVIAHVITNSMSAFADDAWVAQVRPGVQMQHDRLLADGRAVLDGHPLNPTRNSRLSPELRAAFEADIALLDPGGVARTGLYTIPDSPVRARMGENRVPTLLVVGERERRFGPQREWAEANVPHLTAVGLDGGHAVNIDAAGAFNECVLAFFRERLAREDNT
jgi:pimeloyl-ACP methyl ester carboxylesterase